MTEYDKKYGIIKYNKNLYKSYAVFEEGVFYNKNELNDLTKNVKDKKRQIKKFFVPDIKIDYSSDLKQEYKKYEKYYKGLDKHSIDKPKIHKNRYYLKVVKNDCEINTNDNILTFILFNSSYANQFKLDPTIQNCAYLTFEKYSEKNYKGFEIFNLFSIRNSVNELCDTDDTDENVDLIKKELSKRENPEIVFAWGYGKEKDYKGRIKSVKDILRKMNINNLNQLVHQSNITKMMHPGNLSWNKKRDGGFCKNAKIVKYK